MINQIKVLIAFFSTGIIIGILFDIFRIIRKTFKTPNIVTYIQDIIFWILSGVLLLSTIFLFTDGEIRFYMITDIILGAIIYFITISKLFILISTKIILFIKKFVILLITPLLRLKNIIIIPLKLMYKKIYNRF